MQALNQPDAQRNIEKLAWKSLKLMHFQAAHAAAYSATAHLGSRKAKQLSEYVRHFDIFRFGKCFRVFFAV